jgi:hypothetical protein
MTTSVHSRVLQRAAEMLGGRDKLAQYLGVPVADVTRWISGTTKTPRPHFLRMVEFIIDETSPSGGDPAGDAPPANDCSPARRSC